MAKGNAERRRLTSAKKHRGNLSNLKQFRKNIVSEPIYTNLENPEKESISREEPSIEQEHKTIDGNRIISLWYFITTLTEISLHGTIFGCTMANLVWKKEIKSGLISKFELVCNMCNEKFYISTQDPLLNDITLNESAVSGTLGVGCGYYNMKEFISCLNIPCMGEKMYRTCHNNISNNWQGAAEHVMSEAVKEEKSYALATNSVDEQGFPLLSVVVDGCWSKRSYKSNYNAMSGVAAIIGQHTGKILYISVRNKFCAFCNRYKEKDCIPQHTCFKNHSGNSTSMESDIIVEGFKKSVEMYGVKYNKMVGDGDSSTYKKIIEARPYNNLTVEKIECRNHLLRNFCNKLKLVSGDKNFILAHRKMLESRILRMRTGVVCAIKFYKKKRPIELYVKELREDILNCPYHVFGDHAKCKSYFCEKKEEMNNVCDFDKNFWGKIMDIVRLLANHSRSLIYDVDSNIVKTFNSTVAKFVGGKRINNSLKNSYATRCAAAVTAFNSLGQTLLRNFMKKTDNNIIRKLETTRRLKVLKIKVRRIHYRKRKTASVNKSVLVDYGDFCQKPDMTPNILKENKLNFMLSLRKTTEELRELEKETRTQNSCGRWIEERRKLLTASNYARVCKMMKKTKPGKFVKRLLYSTDTLNVPSVNHGKKYEETAILQLERQLGESIQKCGLFVDKDFCFLGASPDGLIGDNTLVEVKCPISAFNVNAKDAIKDKRITFWKYNGEECDVNYNHDWYFQIQGQLQVTKKEKCILGVWTGEDYPLKVEYIYRNNDFWENRMKEKLCVFYHNNILPELVDPRHTRNMPLRCE